MEILQLLNKYHDDGLLYKQFHPTLPLTIWNYTPKVQYEGLWDEITLMSRGLVTDENGDIVARPLKKFFNIEENKHKSTSDFEVFMKMDGSLIIVFWYKDQWVVASRGSFTSDHAISANKIIKNHGWLDFNLNKDFTYLFELIGSDWTRIVVDYGGDERLVLLTAVNTLTGNEYDHTELFRIFGDRLVKRYDGIKDFTILKDMVPSDEEGYVVRFSNQDRLKVKGVEYLRLHKIMTNVSTTSVWEILKSGQDVTVLLENVPDEFYEKIKNYENELKTQFNETNLEVSRLFNEFSNNIDLLSVDKKMYAEWVMKQERKLQPLLFNLYNGKSFGEQIWKMIKPKFRKL